MTREDFIQSRTTETAPLYTAPAEAGLREAVGLFSSEHDLQEAIRELEGTSFGRQDMSILGGRADLENVFGVPVVNPEDVEDRGDVPRATPVRTEERNIGATALVGAGMYVGVMAMALAAAPLTVPAAAAAVAIGGGGGALLGGGILKLLESSFAKTVHDQLRSGGLLLWVHTPDKAKEDLACQILRRHGATHVKIHEVITEPN